MIFNYWQRLWSGSTESTAPETAPAPAATTEASPAPTTTEATPAPAKEKPWYEVRIAQLTARNKTLEEEVKTKPQGEPKTTETTTATSAPVDVETRAAQLAAEREFNKTCDEIYAKGKEEFKDFDSKISNFQKLGGLPPALIEASIEAGPSHKILHYLGENMDEAARVLALPPLKMAVAVSKLGDKLSKAPAVSQLDEPIKPISGRSTAPAGGANPEDMPLDQWMAWRDKQISERKRI